MQAKLQGGAATSRPSMPYACGGLLRSFVRAQLLSFVRASAVADIASNGASSSAARKYFIFIIRFLDCGHLQPPIDWRFWTLRSDALFRKT
jgi:hypothetical protein